MFFSIGLFIGFTIFLGCSEQQADEIHSSKTEKPVRCSGQYNKIVTEDYFGAHSDDIHGSNPTIISHAGSAELLYSEYSYPHKVKFAIAWVRGSDKNIYYRIWDTYTKSFSTGEKLLKNWPSPMGWIKKLGFDDNCTVVDGASTCSWFTWEDNVNDVNMAAVGNNGKTYIGSFFDGHEPSGDTGVAYIGSPPFGYLERRKLLAYISLDRSQVRAKLLNNTGQAIMDIEVYKIPTNDGSYRAFQTDVAYSTVEDRWLVAWAENDWPIDTDKNGKVFAKYVDFYGNPGPDPDPKSPLMYCAWKSDSSECPISKTQIGIKYNGRCFCKSIWLASSYYSYIQNGDGVVKDRYRVHQYERNAQVNANGEKEKLYEGIYDIGCITWCPITEASFFYGDNHVSFQVLDNDHPGTNHIRLFEDDYMTTNAGIVHDPPFSFPQAFRSNGSIAAALSTDGIHVDTISRHLSLSIVDIVCGGCP